MIFKSRSLKNILKSPSLFLCTFGKQGDMKGILALLLLGLVYSNEVIIDHQIHPELQLSWDVSGVSEGLGNTQAYNILARQFGAPRAQSSDIETPVDLFRTKRNLLFSIDGLSYGKLSLQGKILGTKEPITFTESSYTALGSLSVALSGNTEGCSYHSSNIFDSILHLNGDSVTMISGSYSKPGAHSVAPHVESNKQSASFHFDVEAGQFVSETSTSSSLAVSRKHFGVYASKMSSVLGVKVTINGESVSVSTDIARAQFSFATEEDAQLFAELLFVFNFANVVSEKKESPDFFSFHFTSLKSIISKYGDESSEYKVAVALVDAVIDYVVKTLNKQTSYEHTIFYFPVSSEQLNIQNDIEEVASEYVDAVEDETQLSTVHKYYPFIYVSDSKNFKEACDAIKAVVRTPLPKVVCKEQQVEKRSLKRSLQGVQETTTDTDNDVKLFHVSAWTAVALILILITALAFLFSIEIGEDTFYKTSNAALNKTNNIPTTKKN
eukprot:TRINITY_DN8056_c0_g1_i1.p1 TRINITY_DN8056_c0_g1~~TRINITY_DN8056_c0_g1_i1.p1  ORF type:complete len:496 (+),score=134.70 TRINITY_DN8056_c0_g1_i1:81-1568(+)